MTDGCPVKKENKGGPQKTGQALKSVEDKDVFNSDCLEGASRAHGVSSTVAHQLKSVS